MGVTVQPSTTKILNEIIIFARLLLLTITFVVGKLLYIIPPLDRKLENLVGNRSGIGAEKFRDRIFSWKMYVQLVDELRHHSRALARMGEPAPNTLIYDQNANPIKVLNLGKRVSICKHPEKCTAFKQKFSFFQLCFSTLFKMVEENEKHHGKKYYLPI